jgi:hypothetical protein
VLPQRIPTQRLHVERVVFPPGIHLPLCGCVMVSVCVCVMVCDGVGGVWLCVCVVFGCVCVWCLVVWVCVCATARRVSRYISPCV